MGFCSNLVKVTLFTLNISMLVVGLALVILGGLMQSKLNHYAEFSEDKNSKAGYYAMGAGAGVALISFLGCCGVMKKNGTMVKAYAGLLLLLLFAEIGAGIAAFMFKGEAEDIFTRGMMSALRKYTPEGEISQFDEDAGKKLSSADLDAIRFLWDETQEGLKCCGVDSYTDWQDGKSQWVKNHPGDVPDSCCNLDQEGCGKGAMSDQGKIHKNGCKQALVDVLKANIMYVVYGGLGFGFLQIILIIAAFAVGKKMGWDYSHAYA